MIADRTFVEPVDGGVELGIDHTLKVSLSPEGFVRHLLSDEEAVVLRDQLAAALRRTRRVLA